MFSLNKAQNKEKEDYKVSMKWKKSISAFLF